MLPLVAALTLSLPDYRPTTEEVKASYARADRMGAEAASKAFRLTLRPEWLEGGKRFWYRVDQPNGRREFWVVEAATGKKAAAFDDAKLAKALGYPEGKPPFRRIDFSKEGQLRVDVGEKRWTINLTDYATTSEPVPPVDPLRAPEPWRQDLYPPEADPVDSPDGKWTARIRDWNVLVGPKGGELKPVTTDGVAANYYARLAWSPDSSRLVAVRVIPGDRKKVWLIRSTPPNDERRAQLEERVYDQPGDKVDTFTMAIIDPASQAATPLQADAVDYGELPWPEWRKDGKFTYRKMDRGYGRWRMMVADPKTATTETLIDEPSKTFVDSTSMYVHPVEGTDEVIHLSERTGWNQLYLTSPDGKTRPITQGNWVIRDVERADDKKRELLFGASGVNPDEDPYFIHWYRVGYDGNGLTPLTPAPGTHEIQIAPDGNTLIDTYSAASQPPVHELRRVRDGKLLATLEKADIEPLKASGWKAPETFVAKGRDGKTDIWGLVYRPRNFDPSKRYPVVEDIYAGPHDSFVPKGFAVHRSYQSMAELGFIVVSIDGMGTRNRGKAFQDVAYKNIADAGFPDRILWMKALAAKYPQVDIDRVGVFGTSAGGQSSTGALLFHPDFYKVAVSSCGCHDNRMDKIWWNEQWMGKIGPHYAEQSNITNAAKLKGHLMLMVGEMDDNVPPESTYRLADALERAGKEFELVVLPGQRHTSGGTYGERKRRDFFVRHLLGVEPPNPNAD